MEQKRLATLITSNTAGAIPAPATFPLAVGHGPAPSKRVDVSSNLTERSLASTTLDVDSVS